MDLPEAASQPGTSAGWSGSPPGLAAALFSASDPTQRAEMLAAYLRELFDDVAVVLYSITQSGKQTGDPRSAVSASGDEPVWTPRAIAGDLTSFDQAIPLTTGTLGMAGEERRVMILPVATLEREQYSHLSLRRTAQALAYAPLLLERRLTGMVEVVCFRQKLDRRELEQLESVAALAGVALEAAEQAREERNSYLDSIHRLTQLYDLERVLNSTLQMDALCGLIPAKVRDLLQVSAVNLWVFVDDRLTLSGQAGGDLTVRSGEVQGPGQGYVGDVAESGEAALISADDARMERRNEAAGEQTIHSALVTPLMDGEEEIGVIEALTFSAAEEPRGRSLNEDDLFFLTGIAETAAGALRNASLLFAERKVELLESLVEISTRIGSTLHLPRLLRHIVNDPQAVIPYERCSIALDVHGKLQLRAVSGMAEVPAGDAAIGRLRELLGWLNAHDSELHLRQHAEQPISADAELQERFSGYFAQSGARAFYSIPLLDRQGRVGLLCCESSQPDFLNEAHVAMLKLLAAQATVAIRNAQLYREVPLIGLLEPIVRGKQLFHRQSQRRRAGMVATATAAVLLLCLTPLPLRVGGEATVTAAQSALVQPAVNGTIVRVSAREGQRVAKGGVLAAIMPSSAERSSGIGGKPPNSAALNQAGAEQAGAEQAGVNQAGAERAAADPGEDEAIPLLSPISGVVLTPNLEDSAGRYLQAGDSYAEIAELSPMLVNVDVDEQDLALLRPGAPASIKLTAYPGRVWQGTVRLVSPQSYLARNGTPVFYARVEVANPDGELRIGMSGRGRVRVGWRPAGYVLFRRAALWLAQRAWSLLGW